MKLALTTRGQEAGGILVTAMILGAVLGATLIGYLYWVRTQHLLVAQSQAWNQALALAEAGIEEGLAQVNVGFGTNFYTSIYTNWPASAGNLYGPRTNGLGSGSYAVVIQASGRCPTIISTGYAVVPIIGKQVRRVVQVTTTNRPAYDTAMYAQRTITFNGNGIEIDSYDSTDPLHSTNGYYNYATRLAGGDVSTSSGIINIGNANINGKLRTGPTGSYNLGANGFVGDLNFYGPGVQAGWYQNDFNMEVKTITAPNTNTFTTPTGSGTNKYILSGGGYALNGDLRLSSGETLLVSGNATLYVSGNVDMSGSSEVRILPGAALKIYVAGASSKFTAVNNFGNASAFEYLGLPSNTSVTWSGNSDYVGTVYAPNASFSAGGGGSSIYDFQGACVVDTVKMNGHFKFHYDEALKRVGPMSGFIVTSWREL